MHYFSTQIFNFCNMYWQHCPSIQYLWPSKGKSNNNNNHNNSNNKSTHFLCCCGDRCHPYKTAGRQTISLCHIKLNTLSFFRPNKFVGFSWPNAVVVVAAFHMQIVWHNNNKYYTRFAKLVKQTTYNLQTHITTLFPIFIYYMNYHPLGTLSDQHERGWSVFKGLNLCLDNNNNSWLNSMPLKTF